MRRIICLLIAVEFLCGCATVNSIHKNYYKIDYDDGININEAKLIGKKTLIDTECRNKYIIIFPYILEDDRTDGHSDHWFVAFRPKRLELVRSSFLVIVNKATGDVLHFGQFYTKGTLSFESFFQN